ncbi:MAG: hypothetical protein C0465_25340 [Ralstonia sp.]|uniref:ECs_2282 family putative zinc-binding protein n=1 Tax=Ralstonia sp. TaxID=54061 RepID=UPI000D2A4921|nr:hypothetical protein [Ralstonia sp.]MBA4173719.1 hypothetical protein [Hyphomicrobium sp.]MBA4233900.1 hypothetical protein [Ralstonia sp.]PPC80486.1 MAG: hypothetical protein CTY40_09165 [Hyphomicrobium sp.]
MDAEKYSRSITLLCPTCGSTDLTDQGADDGAQIAVCSSCGLEINKDDLISENSENIAAHVKEIGQEISRDFAAEIRKSLREAWGGSKYFKVK